MGTRPADYEFRTEAQAEEHAELLARNIFNITMLGAVAFVVACFYMVA